MFIPDKVNLLYIEDDQVLADVMIHMLNTSKHTVFKVTNKQSLDEGLKFLGEECTDIHDCKIDIILLDLVLPNSKGVETFLEVQKKCPFLPVVIISGFEDLACKCVKLGAQDYLIKPDIPVGLLTRSIKYAIERTKLEERHIESERMFREIINSSPLGFHNYELIDDKLIFKGFNPAAEDILQINNRQFINKSIEEAFPLLAKTEIPKKYKEVIKTGKSWEGGIIEYEDININKGYFRVHVFKTGHNTITASFENVTELITAQKDLKLREEKYYGLVEKTGAGIYEIEFATGGFVYVNDVICKQTGWTKEELFEMGPVGLLTEQSQLQWIKRWDDLDKRGIYSGPVEYSVRTKSGGVMWGLIVAEFIKDEKGNLTGAYVVAIDITKQKVIEEALKKKEEIIFNELENKIHQWREEISTRSSIEIQKLKIMDDQISSISDTNSEVQ
jgi:PAS domain S-box-containing protein